MKNLTDLFEGILDQDLDVTEGDIASSVIKSMVQAREPYMKVYNKIMFDLKPSLEPCPLTKVVSCSKDYTIVVLPRVNSVYPKIQIFTQLNSKCWSGIDIMSGDMIGYTKTRTSIYKIPRNHKSYAAYLLPKGLAQELQELI